jgi:hypothetical protein
MTDVKALPRAFQQFDQVIQAMLKSIEESSPDMKLDPPEDPKPKVKPIIPVR